MSKKIKCVISCPLDTYSGYGKRSYDFIRQLIKVKSDWDIKILSQRWGNCRMGFLKDHGEQDLINRIIPQLTEQPDIWIQITVPNEFQATGKYNIGITAAMETTLCDPSWVQGCNRMNLILVSSTHSKQSLLNSVYRNDNTRETLEIKVPVEVLFEGVDLDTFPDLRRAYEGFRYSHASIMYNVLKEIPNVTKLCQVAIRDFCADEQEIIVSDSRVRSFHDHELRSAEFDGVAWSNMCDSIIAELPDNVYVSFDIDGLSPDLCPNTGTPVPGGLTFNKADHLLVKLMNSGKKIVGFDLVEVAPGESSDWDANVGAKLLYKICLYAARTCN